jgi:hypothetical protein
MDTCHLQSNNCRKMVCIPISVHVIGYRLVTIFERLR